MVTATPLRLPASAPIPASWATAGIADARAFKVGFGKAVHAPAWFTPERVVGVCGVVGYRHRDVRFAQWADSFITCEACKR
jgi:hypothetical protein